MFDWIPRKLRYALGVLTVLSFAVPTGISHDTVITGHTVFKHANGYDKCLASIVGHARSQVLWFNDQALVTTDPRGQYLYTVRAGAPPPPPVDPGNHNPIFGNGVVYEFIDPNDNRWVVLEGYYKVIVKGVVTPEVGVEIPPTVEGEAGLNTEREFVWMVQIGPTFRDGHPGPDDHEFYNFVTLVDTCKFGVDRESNLTHEAGDPYHPAGEVRHDHDVYAADLYIGRAPTFVPLPTNATEPALYSSVVGRVDL